MKLKDLLDVIHCSSFTIDFYDGNPAGRGEGQVTVSKSDAYDYGSYEVNAVHSVNQSGADITLYGSGYKWFR